MSAKTWLRITGKDGNQHVLWLPEMRRHTLTEFCSCRPRIERYAAAVVMHRLVTAAYVPAQRREREH